MALEDYTTRTEQPQNQKVSRRGFLAGLGAGLVVAGTCLSSSYSAEPAKQAQKSVIQTQGLEGKIPKEYEADKSLLVCDWSDEKAKGEYNQLSIEYMETLMQKGKYDPGKKDTLRRIMNHIGISIKYNIECMEKNLLREKDPKEYLKKYIKDESEIKKIKETNVYEIIKKDSKIRNLLPWNIDLNNSDLSDKIYLYECIKTLKEGFKNLGNYPSLQIGPISGNPLVR